MTFWGNGKLAPQQVSSKTVGTACIQSSCFPISRISREWSDPLGCGRDAGPGEARRGPGRVPAQDRPRDQGRGGRAGGQHRWGQWRI